jgi:hypothetical protein
MGLLAKQLRKIAFAESAGSGKRGNAGRLMRQRGEIFVDDSEMAWQQASPPFVRFSRQDDVRQFDQHCLSERIDHGLTHEARAVPVRVRVK